MRPAFRSPRCLPPEKTARASLESSRGALPSLAGDGSRRTCSSTFENDRLDLFAARSRARARGRVRSSGFCRAMFPRARPWAARTPPPLKGGGGDCLAGAGCPDPRQSPNRLEVRGRGEPFLARSPRRLLATETSPRPRSVSDASCHGRRSLALSGVTWGARGAAIASRACRARERQDRATPGLREEIRRTPARGAFRRKVVRGRTKAL